MARSPQTLSIEDRRLLAAWAADCVQKVLAIYTQAAPGDLRVSAAIDQARSFSTGDLGASDAIRRRGGQAGAAARDAPTQAARATAYAAEQAASIAHMGAHALGAAGYVGKAWILGGVDAEVATAQSVAGHLVSDASDDVAAALSSLPILGEHRGGPLGPGRLALGLVGETIREIQKLLITRK